MQRRSSAEFDLGGYLLAVCPLWMQFQRQYNTKFQLYFEKNLQIISRHETPTSAIKKDDPVYFNPPLQIQHFKIQSDKNVDYQWSLYIKRVDIKQNNEEFVEGQKVTFRQQWQEFKNTQKRQFECSVHFSRMKCKFVFLLMIGANNKQLLSMAQKYQSEHKTSILTDGGPPSRDLSSVLSSKTQSERKKVQQKPSLVQINHQFAVNKDSDYEAPMAKKPLSPNNHQNGKEKKKESRYSSNLDIYGQENQKLSNSDLEIGQQIEQRIHQSQTNYKVRSPKNKINVLPPVQSIQPEESSDQKSIRMTQSQLLNDKGQVILPFYKRKSFIIACIVLFLILGLLAFNGDSEKQPGRKMKAKPKKKKK